MRVAVNLSCGCEAAIIPVDHGAIPSVPVVDSITFDEAAGVEHFYDGLNVLANLLVLVAVDIGGP